MALPILPNDRILPSRARGVIVLLLSAALFTTLEAFAQGDADEIGTGIVKPQISPGSVLRFYGVPPHGASPDDVAPFDSLMIGESLYGLDVTYAPPWFVPEGLKMDYEILLLRAMTVTRDWIEVVVNRTNGMTRWVRRDQVSFQEWSDFLLSVFSVEVLSPRKNPLRSGPSEKTAVIKSNVRVLYPLAVRGFWLRVSTTEPFDRVLRSGWIRWTDGKRLLISFSLLS